MSLSLTLLDLACMVDAVLAGTHELTREGLEALRDGLDQTAAMARLLEMDARDLAQFYVRFDDEPASNVVPFRGRHGGDHVGL